jgi:cytoskeleton protein RodZ
MPEMGPEIGATLRETRMRARIDIGEVEMRTKIRAKYLRAIENEEWDLLPGPVYVKSFLRTYAEYLGLDAPRLLDEYKRRYELSPDAHARPLSAVKRDRERERDRASRRRGGPSVPPWAIILVVLIIAGVLLYFIGRHHNAATPKAARGIVPTTVSTATKPPVTHRVVKKKVAAAPSKATLKLVPTGPVWVCVETPAGAKLVDGVTEAAGASIPTVSGSELLVTLGNANVKVTANGKPFPLNASATAIALKVTRTGASALPQAQGPLCTS